MCLFIMDGSHRFSAVGVADYHPFEVVALSPATLHLVTWIGLGLGLGPGRGSGLGLRLGLRCGLPYTANLARVARSLPKVLGPPTRAPPPPMRSAACRLGLGLGLGSGLGLRLGLA